MHFTLKTQLDKKDYAIMEIINFLFDRDFEYWLSLLLKTL